MGGEWRELVSDIYICRHGDYLLTLYNVSHQTGRHLARMRARLIVVNYYKHDIRAPW